MKFFVLAATIALAAAQSVDDMEKTASQNAIRNEQSGDTLKTIQGKGEDVSTGMAQASDSLITVDEVVNAVNQIAGEAEQLESHLGLTSGFAANNLDRAINDASSAMNDALEVALDEITRALSSQKEQVDGNVVGRLSTANVQNAALKDTTDALAERLKAHTDCAADGTIYDYENDECRKTAVSPETGMHRVAHRMFNNDDGREGGYVDNRYVAFKKTQDDTHVRVFYHDNFRVHGHGAWARWHVMICDANGNGCAFCNDPGRMQYWRYAYHQHNWWMNDHWSGSVSGLCKKSDNRNIIKGDYQMKVYIDSARYDTYTGHNTHSMLMVDEVFKF
jgi:hypothetical protein